MFPTVTGKPPPSSPPCAMTASRRLRSSTVPSTARPSWPGCSSAWCRCCGRATLSCWTISPPTKSPVCLTPLKRPAPSCAICRLTVPASIPSNSSSPNSRRCCVKPPPAPSMPCGTPSATCWPPFLPPSAQTTSLMLDTAYQAGDRAKFLHLAETTAAFLGRLRDSANTLDVIERQRIVRLVVKEILIGDDNIVIRHSIPIASTPPPSGDPPTPTRSDATRSARNYLLRSGSNLAAARERLSPLCVRP